MVLSQIFPFVALFVADNDDYDRLFQVLVASFVLWVSLNITFFCSIDLTYLRTFFTRTTASQYTCQRFLESKEDFQRFDAVFESRLAFSKPVQKEIKEWVANNIDRWRAEREEWFNVRLIPDEFLPKDIFEIEGGAKRRRSVNTSVRELVGLREDHNSQVVPISQRVNEAHDAWKSVARRFTLFAAVTTSRTTTM